jgi:hypothetical protein
MNLRAYLDALPRGGLGEFAARVDRSEVYLLQLAAHQGGREASPALAVVIERESDYRVRRWDLRPTDWWLIWPELKDIDGAPDLPVSPEHQEP